jgi:hypothetical protein
MYIVLQKIVKLRPEKSSLKLIVSMLIIPFFMLARLFLVEVCLLPFKVVHTSIEDANQPGSDLSAIYPRDLFSKTANQFRRREIGQTPLRRIYKGENSLFNFNPSKKNITTAVNTFMLKPKVRIAVNIYEKYSLQFADEMILKPGAMVNSKSHHVHLQIPLNKCGSLILNGNLTSANNEEKLYTRVEAKKGDINFYNITFNPDRLDSLTKLSMISPVNVISSEQFIEIDTLPL